MQFIDLNAQQKRIRSRLEKRIHDVLDHGMYIMGPEIRELEKKIADYTGTKHAIGCSSGTDALIMALMARNIGPGDLVFTTPFTFFATAEVITLLGATPVFVDIDPVTFNIDPVKLEEKIVSFLNNDTPGNLKPRGIIVVDIFGLAADYDRIDPIASKYGLFIIEDAAQSFGAEYKGKKTCSFGDIACTSFFPAKPLGCYGDGGMCFTSDDNLSDLMHSLRVHGQGIDKYDNVRIGINGRLDSFQAAILLEKLEIFPEEVELRQKVASRYHELFAGNPLLVTPSVPDGLKSIWAQYSILAEDEKHRSSLIERLVKAGIPYAMYYPTPLHLQTAFKFLNYGKGDFPVSEDCACRIFSLPMHPYLSEEDQVKIAGVVNG